MMSLECLRIYLKKSQFTELEHLLFRIIVLGGSPDDMYFPSRVRTIITSLVNNIRKNLDSEGYRSVEELEEAIEKAISEHDEITQKGGG